MSGTVARGVCVLCVYLKAFAEEEEKRCSCLARWQGVGQGLPWIFANILIIVIILIVCRRRKDVLMSGTVARGGARAALSPLRMDSCIADPQQELLIVFEERNLR